MTIFSAICILTIFVGVSASCPAEMLTLGSVIRLECP